jgi:hypothetical protein
MLNKYLEDLDKSSDYCGICVEHGHYIFTDLVFNTDTERFLCSECDEVVHAE